MKTRVIFIFSLFMSLLIFSLFKSFCSSEGDSARYKEMIRRTNDPIVNALQDHDYEAFHKIYVSNPGVYRNFEENGTPLIMVACRYGNYDAVKYLLSIGHNPNARGLANYTPLISSRKYEEIFILLLENGADPCFKTDKGISLDKIYPYGHERLCTILRNHSKMPINCICD